MIDFIVGRYPVFFHWNADGEIGRVYLPMEESTISANIKKGIISMLQLQTVDTERTEVYFLFLLATSIFVFYHSRKWGMSR